MTSFAFGAGKAVLVGKFPQYGHGDATIFIVGTLRRIDVRRESLANHDPFMPARGFASHLPWNECQVNLENVQIAMTWDEAQSMMQDTPELQHKAEVLLPSTPKALPPGKTP